MLNSKIEAVKQVPEDESYKWKVLAIVMIGTLMSALDSSIVNVSLPKIMADFGASVDDIEWVVTGYMLSFATLMPLTAWMRDRMGSKILYTGALIVFVFGSVFCGLAWNLPSLILARVIQAFGGGALNPIGMAMISDAFHPRDRAKALGYWGVGAVCGPAFGPTLGGFLTEQISWRAIFLINLPIGVFGTIWAIAALRSGKAAHHTKKPFDIFGFGFLSLFLIAFLLGLSKGNKEGWMSAYIMTCWMLSAVGIVGFLTVEFLTDHPVIDLSLFKYNVFTAAAVVTVARSVALYGGTFLLPLFMQQLMGLEETNSGLILLPGAVIIGVIMPISGRVNEVLGPRITALFGMGMLGLSMFMYRDLNVNSSILWGIIWPMFFRGVGVGLLVAPVMAAAMNAVPAEKTAAVSSMLNLLQQVAGSVGIALLGMTLLTRTKFHMQVMGAAVEAKTPATSEALKALFYHARELGYSNADALKVAQGGLVSHVAGAASSAGFEDAFIFGAVVVCLGLAAAFLMPMKTDPVSSEHLVME
jgi:MFS transporter, DHA2 family, multidrug resistance protein